MVAAHRLFAALVGWLLFLATPAAAGDADADAAWIVGRWGYVSAEGSGRIEFGADGSFTIEIDAGEEGRAELRGNWELSGGIILLRGEGESVTMRPERLPDENGKQRARFLMAGAEATAVAWTKEAGSAEEEHPSWLLGTWVPPGAAGGRRYVLLPSGEGLVATTGDPRGGSEPIRWSVQDNVLHLARGGSSAKPFASLDVVREPDAEGRPRARFVQSSQGQVREYAPIYARCPFPAAGKPCADPVAGGWLRREGEPATSLTLLPDGRFERRRAAPEGATLEPGTFEAAGDRLTLTNAALASETWLFRIDEAGVLRLRAEPGGPEIAFNRFAGAEEARRSASAADARHGHDLLVYEERLAPATPVPSSPPAGPAAGGPPVPDLSRAFPREATFLPVSDAGPRFAFRPDGRVSLEVRGAPARLGRYSRRGAELLVRFDDGVETKARLLEGGRFLEHEAKLLENLDSVRGATVLDPR